jgi:hypothetical protein
VSDVAREAIRDLVESRRRDRRFQRLLRENLARQRSVLEDLAGQES